MTQTSNRFSDRFAQLMNDAASVAQGVRREAATMFKSQASRMANDMDLVNREDYEAVKEMAQNARAENEKLEARIAALEAKLGAAPAKSRAISSSRSSAASSGAKTIRSRSSGAKTVGSSEKSPRASRPSTASSTTSTDESSS